MKSCSNYKETKIELKPILEQYQELLEADESQASQTQSSQEKAQESPDEVQ